jgi:hypothetical protein
MEKRYIVRAEEILTTFLELETRFGRHSYSGATQTTWMLTRIMAMQSASLCVRTITPSCGTLPFDQATVRIKPQLAFSQKPLF